MTILSPEELTEHLKKFGVKVHGEIINTGTIETPEKIFIVPANKPDDTISATLTRHP